MSLCYLIVFSLLVLIVLRNVRKLIFELLEQFFVFLVVLLDKFTQLSLFKLTQFVYFLQNLKQHDFGILRRHELVEVFLQSLDSTIFILNLFCFFNFTRRALSIISIPFSVGYIMTLFGFQSFNFSVNSCLNTEIVQDVDFNVSIFVVLHLSTNCGII